MGNDGLVISETEPTTIVGKFTWLQILPSGARKWFERTDSGWQKVKEEDASAPVDHSHPTHGDINFTGSVSVDAVTGLTGEYEGVFKKVKVVNGIITGFELEE